MAFFLSLSLSFAAADVIGESPPATRPGAPGRPCPRAGHSRLQAMRGAAPQAARLSSPSTAQHMAVSMRHAFVPFPGESAGLPQFTGLTLSRVSSQVSVCVLCVYVCV